MGEIAPPGDFGENGSLCFELTLLLLVVFVRYFRPAIKKIVVKLVQQK